MRTDKYTKAVLTVIALMLIVITLKTLVSGFGASPKHAANTSEGSGAAVSLSIAGGVSPVGASPKVPEGNPGSSMGARTGTANAQASGSALGAEARTEAENVWGKVLTKCGDSYYYTTNGVTDLAGGTVVQIRGAISFHLLPSPRRLSPADKLNGLEWEGTSTMTAGLNREADFVNVDSSALALLSWREWADGLTDILVLQRKNGRWLVTHDNIHKRRIFERRLSCEVITKPLPSPHVRSWDGEPIVYPGQPSHASLFVPVAPGSKR
jgi:hypothetical protein